jgi:hypothetical protein
VGVTPFAVYTLLIPAHLQKQYINLSFILFLFICIIHCIILNGSKKQKRGKCWLEVMNKDVQKGKGACGPTVVVIGDENTESRRGAVGGR